jgi:hypothetical protein
MKTVDAYLRENKVKRGSPNPSEAKSLMEQAKDRMNDLLTLSINEKNASFRFESAYECLREAIPSSMAKEGFKPYSHESIVAFAKERGLLNDRESQTFDRYREIRNDINYRGQKVTEEAERIISFINEILSRMEV